MYLGITAPRFPNYFTIAVSRPQNDNKKTHRLALALALALANSTPTGSRFHLEQRESNPGDRNVGRIRDQVGEEDPKRRRAVHLGEAGGNGRSLPALRRDPQTHRLAGRVSELVQERQAEEQDLPVAWTGTFLLFPF